MNMKVGVTIFTRQRASARPPFHPFRRRLSPDFRLLTPSIFIFHFTIDFHCRFHRRHDYHFSFIIASCRAAAASARAFRRASL